MGSYGTNSGKGHAEKGRMKVSLMVTDNYAEQKDLYYQSPKVINSARYPGTTSASAQVEPLLPCP